MSAAGQSSDHLGDAPGGGWLVKSEPEDWGWQQMVAAGTCPWDGVRNAQALGHMRAMGPGDPVLFYHSGRERRIVGLTRVARSFYDDAQDPRSGLVDLTAERSLPRPVALKTIKADGRFDHLALVRQPRLSVMPVDAASLAALLALGGLDAAAGA
ncbi:hypothetical protein CCR85_07220 [Rhodothalassium salexigens]|uniref:EVE domain-containing protein n=1 Tax=Rhodothalassium salexigens TaxID=1086 RepID=UPI001912B252|nr:EVE domain-containing protein [Rhodothalassium salexigens]MBK5911282.1 hypothetical protein [Rhodothalassium salexigens]